MLCNSFYLDIIKFYFFYNISIFSLMYIIFLFDNNSTIKYTNIFFKINKLKFLYAIIFLLLNLAGIPPFIGFFLKVNLVSYFNYTNFFFMFILFFSFYFISIYFYLKNVRFLFLDNYIFFNKNNNIKLIFLDNKNGLVFIFLSITSIFCLPFLDDISIVLNLFLL